MLVESIGPSKKLIKGTESVNRARGSIFFGFKPSTLTPTMHMSQGRSTRFFWGWSSHHTFNDGNPYSWGPIGAPTELG